METDLLKSTPEDQMAEMMLLMQMDKLPPEFGSGSPSDLPLSDFSGESRPGPTIPRNLYENTNMNNLLSPSFHHNNPTTPFHSIPQANNSSNNNNNNYWRCNLQPPENGNGNEDGNSVFPSGNCTSSNNKQNSMAAMREMIFRIAAMQPIYIDPESVKPPKRRNVKISKDPQSVAARHRRERISERIRILQRLVPGGTKMDTASMLDEAIHYVKFLKTQVQSLERAAVHRQPPPVHGGVGFPVVMSTAAVNEGSYFPVMKGYPVMQSGEGSHQAQGFSSD